MTISEKNCQNINVKKVKIKISQQVENFLPKCIIFISFKMFFDFPSKVKKLSYDETTSGFQNSERYHDLLRAQNYSVFGGATIVKSIKEANIIICSPAGGIERLDAIRADMAANYVAELRHIVGTQWVLDCWREETVLDFDSKLHY